jgi:FkbM family methyltransferase
VGQPLPDGYYACIEDKTGTIVIRDLAMEYNEWNEARTTIHTSKYSDYPYGTSYNMMYIEFKGWGESPIYHCDYEKQKCYLKRGDVVVDVGANIGMFARHAMERGVEKVYAFEPTIDAFKCLLLNVDRHKVYVHKACIGNTNDFVDIAMTKGSGTMGAMHACDDRKELHREKVQCYTLDNLIESGIIPKNIDFLKVDVEGSESDVFNGMSEENLSNVNRLAMEYHEHETHTDEMRTDRKKMIQRLKQNFNNNYNDLVYPMHDGNYTGTICLWR